MSVADGDRVRVRWKDALCDAKVIHAHSTDKVDAVYDADGTVGSFELPEE